MSDLVPVILERKIRPKVWGGRALEAVCGISLPDGQKVGETWELYDRPDGSSRIRGSQVTLRELMLKGPDTTTTRSRDSRSYVRGSVSTATFPPRPPCSLRATIR